MYKNIAFLLSAFFVICSIHSCKDVAETKALPVFGLPTDNGPQAIPAFEFINQDSQLVNNTFYDDKIYVADFFFTSCPTICPKLAQSMKRIYDYYESGSQVFLLSHSIDYRHDDVPRLKRYANKLQVTAPKWNFVRGDRTEIHDMAKYYMSIAKDDLSAPGGYDHSGYLVLIDKNKNIRAYCDGTNPDEIAPFIEKIDQLLQSYED